MDPCSFIILVCLVDRKFKVFLDMINHEVSLIQLNALRMAEVKKRDEENLKYLLKKFFKNFIMKHCG